MQTSALMRPGAAAPVLTALRYQPGQTPLLSVEWTSDAVAGGPIGSPVFSADGQTVYVKYRRDIQAFRGI